MKKITLVFLVIIVPITFYVFFKKSATKELKHEIKGLESDTEDTTNKAASTSAVSGGGTATNQQVRGKKPEEAFTTSKAGQEILKVMELFRQLDNPTSKRGKEAWENIQKLRESPRETFDEIKNGVSSLGPEYEPKKQFLIQFASNLDIDKEEKLNFLTKQIKEAVTYAKDPENVQVLLTPSIIFETYKRVAKNPEAADKLLADILPDCSPDVQKTLVKKVPTPAVPN